MSFDKYGKLNDFELKDGFLTYKRKCEDCGKPIGIMLKLQAFEEEELDKRIDELRMNVKLCSLCIKSNAWKIILTSYKVAYKNDSYKSDVIDDIARIILNRTNRDISPEIFRQMLADRGVTAGDAERCIWNMAVDECSLYDKNVVSKPIRWQQNQTVNKIASFLSNFRI